jgi:hypothetical protein
MRTRTLSPIALAVVVVASSSGAADPYRADYIARTKSHINEIVSKDHKSLTHDEHIAINEHWHIAMRALRVREVAQGEDDADAVARVDALLKRKDAAFFKHLEELNAKSPARMVLAAPKIASPGDGQSMPLDGKLEFKIAPYKNATKYYCALVEGSHHWVGISSKPECDLDVGHPAHAKFTAGAAEFRARALVKGTWSELARISLTLAGTSPPAPTAQPDHPPAPAPPAPPEGPSKWDTVYKDGYFRDDHPISRGDSHICPAIGPRLTVSGGKVSIPWIIANPSISQRGIGPRKGRDHSNDVGPATINMGTLSFAIHPDGKVNETVSLKPLPPEVLATILDEKDRAAWSNLSAVKITGEFFVAHNTAVGGPGSGRGGHFSITVPGGGDSGQLTSPSCDGGIRMVEEHFVRADCRNRGDSCSTSNDCCGYSTCYAGLCIER